MLAGTKPGEKYQRRTGAVPVQSGRLIASVKPVNMMLKLMLIRSCGLRLTGT